MTHMDRRRNLDPIRTETYHLLVDAAGVQSECAFREARGQRVKTIVRDAKKSWLVVYEIDLD